MTTKRFQFRFHGLEEHGGEIKAADLARALNALHKAAESATTLLVSGDLATSKARPERGARVAKPIDLVGTWPGDEPVEELLQALRSTGQ